MTVEEIKQIIKEEYFKIQQELYQEVYSEKQRRWACAQISKPASQRPEGLSKEEAEEMCKGPMKKETSASAAGSVAGSSSKPLSREDLAEEIMNILLNKESK
tara:strand:- start:177 stop:482 length:306 start_codon:yes stop_codon:yes gene_type:complete